MIYKALSVHEKHPAYRLPSIREVVGLVSDTLQSLCRNETSIRETLETQLKKA